jgi:hypothetical protein
MNAAIRIRIGLTVSEHTPVRRHLPPDGCCSGSRVAVDAEII